MTTLSNGSSSSSSGHAEASKRRNQIALIAVQDSPISFDLTASIIKLKQLTAKAAKQARDQAVDQDIDIIIVFPEAFLSCYPRGYGFGAVVGSRQQEGRHWFREYHESSVPVCNVEGVEMKEIRRAASENNVTLVIGVIERCNEAPSGPSRHNYGSTNPGGVSTLYCTALTISPLGELLCAHRKLMPTGSERLVWGQGDGAGIKVVDTPGGKVGSVICWENYMPLLRMAMYSKGVEIYAAPTADTRESWGITMRHIAMEGRCFVIGSCQYNKKADFPADYPGIQDIKDGKVFTRGGSMIVGPLGDVLAGPLFDQAGILISIANRNVLMEARWDFDPCGHYSRNDIFDLVVDARSKPASTFQESTVEQGSNIPTI